jgi:hypothetical protein
MENNLPTLAELHHDVSLAFKNDQLNLLLNQPTPDKWVKDHPFAKGVKYLPIDKVELLLTRIFQEWKCEVISYNQLFNSVSVQIRLHYKNPLTGDWSYQDGLGAVGIQTNAGSSASDLSAIKQDAVMKALPAAESYALKDAAEKLGDLFGRNLNRKDVVAFSGSYLKEQLPIDTDTLKNELDINKALAQGRITKVQAEQIREQLKVASV